MPRTFNTAGPCLDLSHYMLPAAQRCASIGPLIDEGLYFVLHAPRQSGKTTLIRNYARELTAEGKYAAVALSVERVTGEDPLEYLPMLAEAIVTRSAAQLEESLRAPTWTMKRLRENPSDVLCALLGAWARVCPRPIVLFIDEIDALQPPVLISVLRQLRDGYCSKPEPFPQSIALVGMRDVRDYKASIRDETKTQGSSSPFNIKSDSLTLRNFDLGEVRALLTQHTEATGQIFEDDAIIEIFEQAQGQPWLTNALASHLTTRWDALVPDRTVSVSRDRVLEARELLIERRDTHLDSLVARLQEDRIRRVLTPILTGESSFDVTYNDDFAYVKDLGLVRLANGVPAIANLIYQEIIPRVLSAHVQYGIALDPPWFIAPDGGLDVHKMLDSFIEFWREHGEVLLRGMPYQEAAPHLVLMAYLQRVVNGGGQITREFALGTRRVDLLVEMGGRKDILELKLDRGPAVQKRGLVQVAGYAKRLGRDVGYLIIFDPSSGLPWEERGRFEEVVQDGVRVVVLWA